MPGSGTVPARGLGRQIDPRGDPEPFEDVLQVGRHGRGRDEHATGYLGVRQTFRYVGYDLQLGVGEALPAGLGTASPPRPSPADPELSEVGLAPGQVVARF